MTTTKTFTLQVDNAQDLYKSTLFWKYNGDANHKKSEIYSNSVDKVKFQIEAKPSKIEYWYQNLQYEEEKVRRIYNLRQNQEIQVDKFNCQNVVLKCSIGSQDYLNNTQMFYVTQERNQKIEFNQENLIHLPFGKQATFLLEYQGGENLYTEVKFIIRLDQRNYNGNFFQLNINQDDIFTYLFGELKKNQQQLGNIKFEIIERNQKGVEEIIIVKYKKLVQEFERQSISMDDLIKKSQILEQNIESFNNSSNLFTKQGNFFSDQQCQNHITTKYLQQSQIMSNQSGSNQESFFRKSQGNLNYPSEKKQQQYIQVEKNIKFDNLIEQEKNKQQEQAQLFDTKTINQTSLLQPIIYDNNTQQYDYQYLFQTIKQQNELIMKLKLQIQQQGFELRNEKQKIEDNKRYNNLSFFQNFRKLKAISKNSRLLQSATNFKINPVIKIAKEDILKNTLQSGYETLREPQNQQLKNQQHKKINIISEHELINKDGKLNQLLNQ